MQSLLWKPFLLFLIIINVLTWTLAYVFPQIYGVSWPYSMLVLATLYGLSFLVFSRSTQSESKTAALLFLALTTGKMLLGMIYVLVLVMAFEIDSLRDMLYFVSLYFLFLALEVVVFTTTLKKNSTAEN